MKQINLFDLMPKICLSCKQQFYCEGKGKKQYCSDACRQMLWRKNNIESYRISQRLRRYGLNEIKYNQRLIQQNEQCAICHESINKHTGHVDHCHKRGPKFVRGILCRRCNQGLGAFKDDENMLKMALIYLKQFEINL